MDSENLDSGTVRKNHRPALLSVLCVLTFIGSGCSLLSYLFMWIGFENLRHIVFETDLYEAYFAMAPAMRTSMEAMFSLPRWFYLLCGLFYVASFAGAVFMWRLKRIGFHIYTIAQCMVVLLGMLVMPDAGIPYQSILWTGLFVLLYGICVKSMNK